MVGLPLAYSLVLLRTGGDLRVTVQWDPDRRQFSHSGLPLSQRICPLSEVRIVSLQQAAKLPTYFLLLTEITGPS